MGQTNAFCVTQTFAVLCLLLKRFLACGFTCQAKVSTSSWNIIFEHLEGFPQLHSTSLAPGFRGVSVKCPPSAPFGWLVGWTTQDMRWGLFWCVE